jgi:hypothetical protein
MTSTRFEQLVMDTVVCLTLDKWETVSGRFGGYLKMSGEPKQWLKVLGLGTLRQVTKIGDGAIHVAGLRRNFTI